MINRDRSGLIPDVSCASSESAGGTVLHPSRRYFVNSKAFQDFYPEELSHCYGCGRLNEQGYQIKSYWDGEETIASFTPQPYHIAIPGYVYGGLLASLIDCHGTGTAAAAAYRAAGRDMGTEPALRFVTASLQVEYLRPTPLGVPLEIRGKIEEIKGRKVVVKATVTAKGELCARGQVVAVQMPEHMMPSTAG
ncbi:MAG: PaaI family thioesterase [Candidatus Competibacteraceae bacterium]|nr:PaaI family thioesterase [Candidatus Competibacteraceae bacterium]MCP5132745.1 PaaI family thioesterase [Gammaproteobacteria bacterium]